MGVLNYPDVPVDANGQATLRHIASHHVRGIPGAGAGEVTLCGLLITYDTWQGEAPDAPWCAECQRLDA